MENYARYLSRVDIDENQRRRLVEEQRNRTTEDQRRRMFDDDLRRRYGDNQPFVYYPYNDPRRYYPDSRSRDFADCVMRCRDRY